MSFELKFGYSWFDGRIRTADYCPRPAAPGRRQAAGVQLAAFVRSVGSTRRLLVIVFRAFANAADWSTNFQISLSDLKTLLVDWVGLSRDTMGATENESIAER